MKRIGIIGTGAMGSLFASHLAATGVEVWAFDLWREHVEAIRRDGLIVHRDGSERSVRMHATTAAGEIGICDVAMVFVKTLLPVIHTVSTRTKCTAIPVFVFNVSVPTVV